MSVDYAELIRLARKGKKAEERGKATAGCITSMITWTLLAFLKGWLFMLAVQVVHNHWWPAVPGIGYWWSVLIVYLLPFGGTTSSSKSSS